MEAVGETAAESPADTSGSTTERQPVTSAVREGKARTVSDGSVIERLAPIDEQRRDVYVIDDGERGSCARVCSGRSSIKTAILTAARSIKLANKATVSLDVCRLPEKVPFAMAAV